MVEAAISELPHHPLHNVEGDGLQCRCLWPYSFTQTLLSSPCPTKGKYDTLQTSMLALELTHLRLSLTSASLGSSRG